MSHPCLAQIFSDAPIDRTRQVGHAAVVPILFRQIFRVSFPLPERHTATTDMAKHARFRPSSLSQPGNIIVARHSIAASRQSDPRQFPQAIKVALGLSSIWNVK